MQKTLGMALMGLKISREDDILIILFQSTQCVSLLSPGLFTDLDTHSHLGVITYGVSMTTLEDVYLKLEVEAEIDQAGGLDCGCFPVFPHIWFSINYCIIAHATSLPDGDLLWR